MNRSLIVLVFVLSLFIQDCPPVPCVVHVESPAYPALGVFARLQGDVIVQAQIGADGRILSAKGKMAGEETLRQNQLLMTSAVENARSWVFSPGEIRSIEIRFEYRLVEPAYDSVRPSRTTFDFPGRVRIESNFIKPNH